MPVSGYEGWYSVSNLGSVARIRTRGGGDQWRILKAHYSPDKHGMVSLSKHGIVKSHPVHRLVLEAFVGPPPKDKPLALHRDDNKRNNALDNLYWGSSSDNAFDRVTNGVHNQAVKTHCKRGHEFTEGNTYITSKGSRQCVSCSRSRYEENALKRGQPIRIANGSKTHCKRGHEYNEENTYYRKDRTGRMCNLCREVNRKRREDCQRQVGTRVTVKVAD